MKIVFADIFFSVTLFITKQNGSKLQTFIHKKKTIHDHSYMYHVLGYRSGYLGSSENVLRHTLSAVQKKRQKYVHILVSS